VLPPFPPAPPKGWHRGGTLSEIKKEENEKCKVGNDRRKKE